ncbi:MAG TPA: hypothetical protein VM925_22890 [Labilithrix sp.]|nr:hypothetical protein [Labilithrix sp.]
MPATKIPAWLAAIGASVGVVGVGAAVLASSTAAPLAGSPPFEHPSSGARTLASASELTPLAPVVPAPADGTEHSSEAPPVVLSAPTPVKRSPQAAVSSAVHAVAPVEDELTFLRRAKLRLAERDAEGALDILDAHAKTHPRGTFAEEAEALRVEALVARGDGVHAQRAADVFLERHPESPYAQRVRSSIHRIPR